MLVIGQLTRLLVLVAIQWYIPSVNVLRSVSAAIYFPNPYKLEKRLWIIANDSFISWPETIFASGAVVESLNHMLNYFNLALISAISFHLNAAISIINNRYGGYY